LGANGIGLARGTVSIAMEWWGSGNGSATISGVSDFKKLLVWQKAHALGLHAHRVATGIRRSQDLALRAQITRAAMSIPANIVEGRRQESEKEFSRFLRTALNSGCELEYHLIVARDIGVISESDAASLLREVIEVRRMIHGLPRKITTSPKERSPEMPV
jgi:four helix bundle protein